MTNYGVIDGDDSNRLVAAYPKQFRRQTNGHVLLAEDLTGKGHRYVSRPLGNEDWIIMFVEIDQPKPVAPRPTN